MMMSDAIARGIHSIHYNGVFCVDLSKLVAKMVHESRSEGGNLVKLNGDNDRNRLD